jgi:hypothetical protein
VKNHPIEYQRRQMLTSKVQASIVSTTKNNSYLDTTDLANILKDRVQQDVERFTRRLNEQIFGNWTLWVGVDGKEYFNWSDLPDKELLRARLTGKYKLGE